MFLLALLFFASEPPEIPAASACALCHTQLGKEGKQGQFPLWRGSAMSMAARDSYWLAKVGAEVGENPRLAAVIEDKCLTCHAPAQHYGLKAAGQRMELAALTAKGREGVGCSVCHMIEAGNLGEAASFGGGFRITTKSEAYGPHEAPFQMPMLHHTGLSATQGLHVLKPELCATCHTVTTPTVDAEGNVRGEFLEQAPYLEWKASSFADGGMTCQNCHVPAVESAEYIAHRPPGGPFPPTRPRKPFAMHTFLGGNTLLPALLDVGDGSAVKEFLKEAAAIEVKAERKPGALDVAVKLTNLTGHKLPTAFPSRRVWLRVKVSDSQGRVVFESGGTEPGAQPHHPVITNAAQVQVYEAELADLQGRPTVSLLRAAKYAKDNRILPAEFDASKADKRILPAGISGDTDFLPGSDTTMYRIAGAPGGTLTVEAEAVYQTVKPSHATLIDSGKYRAHGGPVRIAAASVTVQALRASTKRSVTRRAR